MYLCHYRIKHKSKFFSDQLIVSIDVLGICDLREIYITLKEYGFCPEKWMELGLQLQISYGKLCAIRANHKDEPHRCLSECLNQWLSPSSSCTCTWIMLAEALFKIDFEDTAKKIIEKCKMIIYMMYMYYCL